MKSIAIFASGKGSNAKAIIDYFHDHAEVKVVLVLTNNPEAAGAQRHAQGNLCPSRSGP